MTLLERSLHIDGRLFDFRASPGPIREMLRQRRGISQSGVFKGVFFDRVLRPAVLTIGEMANRFTG
jgi:hypothetical protein